MDYESAFRRKEILTPATVQVTLEDTVLSEISQSQKDKSASLRSLEAWNSSRESRWRCWEPGQAEGGVSVSRGRVSVLRDETNLEIHGDDVCTTLWMYLMPLNCALKKWLKCSFLCYV